MANVKCVYCSEKIDKEGSYRVAKVNKENHFYYYCSEEEYNYKIKLEEEKLAEKEAMLLEREEAKLKKAKASEERQKLIDYICYEFLDYQHGMKFPTSLTKSLSELNSFYAYDIIMEAIKRGEDTIRWKMLNGDFTSDYGKVRYIMVVIEGNVNNVYKEWKRKEEQVKVSEFKANADKLINHIDVTTNVKMKPKNPSVLDFLGEDDL